MKICVAICEYNPLHVGHITHLNFIKENIKPDILAVILSGNFVQRGEPALQNKYARAIWAIKAGADVVFELPTIFATGNAETFASGALKLVNSLCGEKTLCFGTECNDTKLLIDIAKEMLIESKDYKLALKKELDSGVSYAKARFNALKSVNSSLDLSPLDKPNNILGIEYIKAILKNNYDIDIKTITRSGGYNDVKLNKINPSALSIRTAIENGKRAKCKLAVPKYVYSTLPKKLPDFSREIIYSLMRMDKSEIKKLPDCKEGLENKIKAIIKDNFTINELISKLKSKRYTETRLKRILLSSMLNIDEGFVKDGLKSKLYLKVLALKKDRQDVLSTLSKSDYPLITRKSDVQNLTGTQLECFKKDVFANDVYSAVTNEKINEYEMKLV